VGSKTHGFHHQYTPSRPKGRKRRLIRLTLVYLPASVMQANELAAISSFKAEAAANGPAEDLSPTHAMCHSLELYDGRKQTRQRMGQSGYNCFSVCL
jgi:hypothetical protein